MFVVSSDSCKKGQVFNFTFTPWRMNLVIAHSVRHSSKVITTVKGRMVLCFNLYECSIMWSIVSSYKRILGSPTCQAENRMIMTSSGRLTGFIFVEVTGLHSNDYGSDVNTNIY